MLCPRCGKELIWNSDFDSEDIGCPDNGIVTYYSCTCGVSVEVFVPFENDDEEPTT